jgi:hypothetical protein
LITEEKAYGMTETITKRAKRRMRTVGKISLISIQVPLLSSSKQTNPSDEMDPAL